jgi:hypothetical protein
MLSKSSRTSDEERADLKAFISKVYGVFGPQPAAPPGAMSAKVTYYAIAATSTTRCTKSEGPRLTGSQRGSGNQAMRSRYDPPVTIKATDDSVRDENEEQGQEPELARSYRLDHRWSFDGEDHVISVAAHKLHLVGNELKNII